MLHQELGSSGPNGRYDPFAAMSRNSRRTRTARPSRMARIMGLVRTAGRQMLKGDGPTWLLLLAFVLLAGITTPLLRRTIEPPTSQPATVRFLEAPAWLGQSLIDHLGRVAIRQIQGDPLDRADLVAAREALQRSGWFESVAQVSRAVTGDIEIDAVFLQPTTIVTDAFGDVVIDALGRPLPEGSRMVDDGPIIRIVNPRESRPRRPGRPWPGDDMIAAMRLHALLEHHTWTSQITAIDLSEFDRTGSLLIQTDLPATLQWGSAPGEETPLESLADHKIQWLDQFHRDHGRIDAHHRGTIDLRSGSHVLAN